MKIGIIGTGGIATSAHIPNYVKAGMEAVILHRIIDRIYA